MLETAHFIWRELALFAVCGTLLFALDDLAMDIVWLVVRRRDIVVPDQPAPDHADSTLAIFVPAWDEAAVLPAMIAQCRQRWAGEAYHLFIGIYANDAATLAAAQGLSGHDVTLAINPKPGPTTKADCLNAIWHCFSRTVWPARKAPLAIVLHDAEDLVDPSELRAYRFGLSTHAMVQLPVIPLPLPRSRWVSGHYADEFAEAHGKDLVVRTALGASLPSAGVGTAIRCDVMAALAEQNGGRPFADDSLTEDYELGLRLAALGHRGLFLRCRAGSGAPLIAVRAHFPATLALAARQKARWIIGIALAGWDRIGWSGGPIEWWMRWRDRRSLLAALLLVTGYAALGLGGIMTLAGAMPATSPWLEDALLIGGGMLLWRAVMRTLLTGQCYGLSEAWRAAPRMFVSNMVAIMAARRALLRYIAIDAGAEIRWDKTQHSFPETPA